MGSYLTGHIGDVNGMAQELAGFADHAPPAESFREALIAGLAHNPKRLPSKFIYDERGSQLFDAILDRPEYYVPRVEMGLLRDHADEIAAMAGPRCALIDYGSGSMAKARILLERLRNAAVYVPLDISAKHLLANALMVAADFPAIPVYPVCADFLHAFPLPDPARAAQSRLGFFPGSTIGNMTDEERLSYLRRAAEQLQGGGLLVGVDLKKDPARLNAAYNDAQGVTAAFNLNLLARINRELAGSFDLAAFEHQAVYNPRDGRIEMYLRSRVDHEVEVRGRRFRFRAGERIHTENSYKYGIGQFQDLARSAGWQPRRVWTDRYDLFSVHELVTPI